MIGEAVPRFEIQRPWFFPFLVAVWEEKGTGEDWKKGAYTWYLRRGVFFRRRTAQNFVRWLEDREGA